MSVGGKLSVGARPVELSRDWMTTTRYVSPAAGSLPKLSAYIDGLGSGDELAALTLTGNEITDLIRRTNVQGDGRAWPDFSTGVHEATTNLLPNGNAATNTNGAGGTPTYTRTRDTTRFKFGSTSFKLSNTVETTDGYNFFHNDTSATEGGTGHGVPVTGGQVYTFSAWLTILSALGGGAGGTKLVSLRVIEWNAAGAVVRDNGRAGNLLVSVGQTFDWTRTFVSYTMQATTTNVSVRVNADNVIGDIYVGGIQIEQKAYPTPYVHTDGGTATRSNGRVQAPVSIASTVQGWMAMRVRMGISSAQIGGRAFMALNDNTLSNRLALVYNGTWATRRIAATVGGTIATVADSWAVGDVRTIILSYDAANIGISLGGAFASVANGGTFTPLSFDIGFEPASGVPIGADILWFAYGAGVVSTADAAALAALPDNPSSTAALPSRTTSLPKLLWTGQTTRYRAPGSPNPSLVEAVLYDAVGTLVATSDPLTVNPGDAPAWRDLTFSSSPTGVGVAAVTYEVGLIAGGAGSNVARAYADSRGAGRLLADTYSDGPATPLGSGWPTLDDFSLFGSTFAAWAVPDELETWYARLPWAESQKVFASTSPVAASAVQAEVAWHGTGLNPERGAFAVAKRGGKFDGAVGERLRISVPSPARTIYVYVHDVADIDQDLSVPRRAFSELDTLCVDWVEATVTRMA